MQEIEVWLVWSWNTSSQTQQICFVPIMEPTKLSVSCLFQAATDVGIHIPHTNRFHEDTKSLSNAINHTMYNDSQSNRRDLFLNQANASEEVNQRY